MKHEHAVMGFWITIAHTNTHTHTHITHTHTHKHMYAHNHTCVVQPQGVHLGWHTLFYISSVATLKICLRYDLCEKFIILKSKKYLKFGNCHSS